ncbi:hypothetical protein BKA62DRAFT_693868 [Auriculariales sp. MPI-PUGE-AT-0066]|nr:hypothetical protein BKA62DRAFT_693868 [Auriculariales sp. MPI-PUGE-AT-0066]
MPPIKRAEAGADTAKGSEIDPAQFEQLKNLSKEFLSSEIVIERHAIKESQPLYEKRRTVLKGMPGFWPRVFGSTRTAMAAVLALDEDQEAIKYLEDVWIVRDAAEPRVFTIELYFKENPFFSNSVLKKVYKYTPAKEKTEKTEVDANGITEAAIDFDWEEDVTAEAFQITWKDEAHNLTKKYPASIGKDEGDDEEFIEEFGSFFNFFENAKDFADLGPVIGTELFPDAIQLYINPDEDDEDFTDDDEEDEDDDEEIDLEQPKRKKAKKV